MLLPHYLHLLFFQVAVPLRVFILYLHRAERPFLFDIEKSVRYGRAPPQEIYDFRRIAHLAVSIRKPFVQPEYAEKVIMALRYVKALQVALHGFSVTPLALQEVPVHLIGVDKRGHIHVVRIRKG